MKLIVGLGNPGPQYARTRHNIGFMAVDALASRWDAGAIARQQFQGLTFDVRHAGERIVLLKPMTYMNRSGQAVSEAVRFFKLELEDLMVLVDDVALPMGTIRLRGSGSAGKHNGLADISRLLASDDWPRLRIGIDPPGRVPRVDYVLQAFSEAQRDQLPGVIADVCAATECWLTDGLNAAMNRFNRKPASPGEDDSTTDATPDGKRAGSGERGT